MKKITSLLLLVVLCVTCAFPALAVSPVSGKTEVWTAPATETMINGQPESSIPATVDVLIGPYFSNYINRKTEQIDEYKLIAKFKHDNRNGSASAAMKAQITVSEAQGGEWGGNVNFTDEIKTGIISSLKASVGVSYKASRSRNEAVGYSVDYTVPRGKIGHVDLYYRGTKVTGQLTTWSANTSGISSSKRYSTCDITAVLYPSDNLDIYSKSYDTYS